MKLTLEYGFYLAYFSLSQDTPDIFIHGNFTIYFSCVNVAILKQKQKIRDFQI